jgi:hypothetical protein
MADLDSNLATFGSIQWLFEVIKEAAVHDGNAPYFHLLWRKVLVQDEWKLVKFFASRIS